MTVENGKFYQNTFFIMWAPLLFYLVSSLIEGSFGETHERIYFCSIYLFSLGSYGFLEVLFIVIVYVIYLFILSKLCYRLDGILSRRINARYVSFFNACILSLLMIVLSKILIGEFSLISKLGFNWFLALMVFLMNNNKKDELSI